MKELELWDNWPNMQKIYKRWWFFPALLVLIVGGWYFWGYASWWLAGVDSRAENRSAYLGWLKMEADSKALEAQYRADNYGGTTPEETLRLFIEVLEKKNYELASKYYSVEQQTSAHDSLLKSESSGHIPQYVSILKGTKRGVLFSDQKTYPCSSRLLHARLLNI